MAVEEGCDNDRPRSDAFEPLDAPGAPSPSVSVRPHRCLFGAASLSVRSRVANGSDLKKRECGSGRLDARTARQFPLLSACSTTLEYDDSPMLKLIWSYTSPSKVSSNTSLKRSESC